MTATMTAQPRMATTASSETPKAATQATARATHARAAAGRRRTSRDSPRAFPILSLERATLNPPTGYGSPRAFSTTIRTPEQRPLRGVRARKPRDEDTVREPLNWQAARRWLIWPTAAALVVAIGALLGVRLAEDGRPLAAAVLVASLLVLRRNGRQRPRLASRAGPASRRSATLSPACPTGRSSTIGSSRRSPAPTGRPSRSPSSSSTSTGSRV